MSYLEIYNENIRDLLDPSSGYLELRDESKGKNIQVWKVFSQFLFEFPRLPDCQKLQHEMLMK